MSTRARNSAEPSDVAKILRANHRFLDLASFTVAAMDKVVHNLAGTLVDIIEITARPTQNLFQAAAIEAFKTDVGEALLFGQRLSSAVSYCRTKLKGSVTGQRLHPSVLRVCKALEAKPNEEAPVVKAASLNSTSPLNRKRRSAGSNGQGQLSDDGHDSNCFSGSTTKYVTSAASIRAMYGLPSSAHCVRATSPPSHVEVVSSQEVDVSPRKEDSSSSRMSLEKPVQFEDASKACLVRMVDGFRVEAVMKPGPNGFAVGFFGAESFPTEIPNLVLSTIKAPKLAVQKKPAARSAVVAKSKPASKESDADSDIPSTKAYQSPRSEEDESQAEDLELFEEPPPADVRQQYGLAFVKPKPQIHNGGRLALTIVESKGYIVWDGKSWVNLTKTQAEARGKTHGQVLLEVWKAILTKNLCSKEEAVAERDAILAQ